MNFKYVFLGHHNFGLSLIIDNLYEHFGTELSIEIVENMDAEKNPIYNVPFVINEQKLSKINFDTWQPSPFSQYFLSSVSPGSRRKIFDQFTSKFKLSLDDFPISSHPSAVISKSVKCGLGTYIGPLSVVAPFCEIGRFCFVNRLTAVGHHCLIEDFVTLSAGVQIGSKTVLETGVNVGMGATIFDGVKIGKDSVIGAGSLVTKDIPTGVVAYGSPAKVIREINDMKSN